MSDLIEPLAEALSVAGPGDDLLLLSTHRRGEGILRTPTGLTARLFVQGDALNLIVNDARRDFVNAYIGSRIPPTFAFGSRTTASAVALQDPARRPPTGWRFRCSGGGRSGGGTGAGGGVAAGSSRCSTGSGAGALAPAPAAPPRRRPPPTRSSSAC